MSDLAVTDIVVPPASGPSPPRRAAAGASLHRPEITAALTRALMEEWARVGYAALSLEAVAKRAGVGKAALYRRWPSKLAMVSDSFASLSFGEGRLPDRGSLEADLSAALRELRRLLRHPLVRRILPDLHAEMPRSPELARLVRDRVQAPRRALIADMLGRAIIRREVPADTDLGTAADLIVALMYWRVVATGGRADDEWLDEVAGMVMGALGAR